MNHIHRTVSHDGTEIAGHVEGKGSPLVLVHGSLEDGDLDWRAMLPHLRDHFTCYLPSTRGRGLSGESADLAPERRLEDVVSFVDSIGEPVHLFGESDGGALALGTAARSEMVSTVAAYEPVVFEAAGDDIYASLEETLPRVGAKVVEGRLGEAARIFSELIANDDELAAPEAPDYFEEAGQYMPLLLEELEQGAQSEASPTDRSLLAQVEVPVLLLQGSKTKLRGWISDGVRYVADHAAHSRMGAIVGAGHFGVALEPEAIADEVTRFITSVPVTAS